MFALTTTNLKESIINAYNLTFGFGRNGSCIHLEKNLVINFLQQIQG